ncbi:hypothetical protein JVT61DRAFT_11059 [Boletus reticuloceps]|uniref:Uncharacterized protein n=1 Tax=Boletus reticuloceps TaxID=495285 RepID=A0A8I2YF13_9AGAM|nr:hypothetical protein JVT61DRAFT_11059 [Boletus reticuloceps]
MNLDLSALTQKQSLFASHVFKMLQVTKFPWEDKNNIGKIPTLVRKLAVLYASQADHRQYLLTVDDGYQI